MRKYRGVPHPLIYSGGGLKAFLKIPSRTGFLLYPRQIIQIPCKTVFFFNSNNYMYKIFKNNPVLEGSFDDLYFIKKTPS